MVNATKNLTAINWVELRDVDVAKELGVSRERARQLRNEFGSSCKNQRKSSNQIEIEKFINKTPTHPASAVELYKILPVKISEQSAYSIFKRLRLKLDYKRKPKSGDFSLVDWRLPNSIIDAIWSHGRLNWAANTRARVYGKNAKWHIGGGQGFSMNKANFESMMEVVEAQAKSAAASQFLTDIDELKLVCDKIKNKVLAS